MERELVVRVPSRSWMTSGTTSKLLLKSCTLVQMLSLILIRIYKMIVIIPNGRLVAVLRRSYYVRSAKDF